MRARPEAKTIKSRTFTHKKFSIPRPHTKSNRRFQLSKTAILVLSFIWGKEDQTKQKPYEVDYPTLLKKTGLSRPTLERACSQLKREGWLQRVVLNPFSRGNIPRVVWRIPYGQFHLIREVLEAKGNKAEPVIISVIRRTHNPMSRKELQTLLKIPRRTLQRSVSKLVQKGNLERYRENQWTHRNGWKKRTLYRLPRKRFKEKPLTEWIQNHKGWNKNA